MSPTLFLSRNPVANQQPVQNVSASLEQGQQHVRFDGLKVLVVDDDIDSVDLIAFLLDDHGARIYPAKSASEALNILQQTRTDLLISDLLMPDQDGFWLIRQIRELETAQKLCTMPAIAMSAGVSERSFAAALACGYQQCLSKPIDFETLFAAIARLTQNPG